MPRVIIKLGAANLAKVRQSVAGPACCERASTWIEPPARPKCVLPPLDQADSSRAPYFSWSSSPSAAACLVEPRQPCATQGGWLAVVGLARRYALAVAGGLGRCCRGDRPRRLSTYYLDMVPPELARTHPAGTARTKTAQNWGAPRHVARTCQRGPLVAWCPSAIPACSPWLLSVFRGFKPPRRAVDWASHILSRWCRALLLPWPPLRGLGVTTWPRLVLPLTVGHLKPGRIVESTARRVALTPTSSCALQHVSRHAPTRLADAFA